MGVLDQTPTRRHEEKMKAVSVSLIVLQCVSAVKYLGPAPLATHSSLSPSFLPYRTALDVLQPQLSFSYPWTPLVPRYHPLSGAFILFQPHFVSGPHNAVVVSELQPLHQPRLLMTL